MFLRRTLTALLICGCLGSASPAYADAVTFWNDITVRAVTAGRPGPVGFLDVALVQAAVHDAVQVYEKRFTPYHVDLHGAAGSPDAAVAAAAHGMLRALYPAQQQSLDESYANFLQANGLAGNLGIGVGQHAAAALLTEYRAAPNPLPQYTGGLGKGRWRPTPSYQGGPPAPFSSMAFVYLAEVRPFTLNRNSQFRPQPPPPLASQQYRRDYDEVKLYGARFNSARTPEQTDLAHFWNDNVVAQWNRVLRGVAEAHITTLGDTARLFALANLATADALISCWDAKRHFSYWRPVTAIQEGDDDGNAHTIGDAQWQPLVDTPNYPEYASGANNVSGAMTSVLTSVLGTDDLTFTITSNAPHVVQRERTYSRISDAAMDVVEARMLLGFHFRFGDEAGRRQGSRVAHWVVSKFLRPVSGKGR